MSNFLKKHREFTDTTTTATKKNPVMLSMGPPNLAVRGRMIVYALIITFVTIMSWMASELVRLRGQMNHVMRILSAQRLPTNTSSRMPKPPDADVREDSGGGVSMTHSMPSSMSGLAATLLRTAMPIPERLTKNTDVAQRVEDITASVQKPVNAKESLAPVRAPAEGDVDTTVSANDADAASGGRRASTRLSSKPLPSDVSIVED